LLKKLDESFTSSDGSPEAVILRTLAQGFKDAACASSENVVGLSTLRGQYADNRKWFSDPARPAIIIGTVDMIGSRLLFAGYGGVGRYYRSTQAGLLRQDSLIVIDEAQLSPTFEKTARRLQKFICEWPAIRRSCLMTLSATISNFDEDEEQSEPPVVFGRDEIAADLQSDKGRKRLTAQKKLQWLQVPAPTIKKGKENAKEANERFADAIVESASRFFNGHAAVVIYLNTVEMVNLVAAKLESAVKQTQIEDAEPRILKITGEMRGDERDKLLTSNRIFNYFKPKEDRTLTEGCRFIVATAAGEVGIDLDADHGICDLVSLERMIQRFGRINRLGNGAATITVAYDAARLSAREALEASSQNESDTSKNIAHPFDIPAYYAFRALQASADSEDNIDASPMALRELESDKRAWSVPPVCPPLDSARIDDWSLTTLSQKDYPRPLVAYWLRGVTADDTATTTFCWRADLKYAASDEDAVKMIETVPIASREKADVAVHRAMALVKELAKNFPASRVVVIDGNGAYTGTTLGKLCNVKDDKIWIKDDELRRSLSFTTLVLPIEVGGLDEHGNPLQQLPKALKPVVPVKDIVNDEQASDEKWLRLVITKQGGECFVKGTLHSNGIVLADDATSRKKFSSPKAVGIAFGKQQKRNCVFISNNGDVIRGNDAEGEDDESASDKPPTFIAYLLKRDAPEQLARDGDNASLVARRELFVNGHNEDVKQHAQTICEKLKLEPALASAIVLAASRHDNGKARRCWQRAISNSNFNDNRETALAKSNRAWFDLQANAGYRHEFGSLVEALDDEEINTHPHRDLILHLIAAHHGYARPYFPERAFDRERLAKQDSQQVAHDAMNRFACLQQKYGWWQLAYLEALLKAADGLASREHEDTTR
ncbi:MAG: type I-U CRISPR-associated helicase/endonuclease Cas3, partial [Acidobacteriota bacterium]|nr:type I-U CRISPR-associated helicase/endonuclease Cas3 [Acidobacteriota bacterium]